MVKDDSDKKTEHVLPPLHGIPFPINNKGYFKCTISETWRCITRPLLHQVRSTGCNEKQFNESAIRLILPLADALRRGYVSFLETEVGIGRVGFRAGQAGQLTGVSTTRGIYRWASMDCRPVVPRLQV